MSRKTQDGEKLLILTEHRAISVLNSEASAWIARLRLKKHPEGGYFRETYRSEMVLDNIPGYRGSRHVSTAIYYMLADDQVSLFHRVKSDELWHHYAGGSLTLYSISKGGGLSKINIGKEKGTRPQAVIEGNSWTAASIKSGSFCLVGCTVSPGFDYRDWELGTARRLVALYPRHKKIIERYAIV